MQAVCVVCEFVQKVAVPGLDEISVELKSEIFTCTARVSGCCMPAFEGRGCRLLAACTWGHVVCRQFVSCVNSYRQLTVPGVLMKPPSVVRANTEKVRYSLAQRE